MVDKSNLSSPAYCISSHTHFFGHSSPTPRFLGPLLGPKIWNYKKCAYLSSTFFWVIHLHNPLPSILMIPSKEHFLKIQVILQSKCLAKELVNEQVAFQWQTIIASVLIHNEFLQILILVIKNGESNIWDWSATSAALFNRSETVL